MLGEIASGLSIFEFIAKWYRKIRPVKQEQEDTIASRFFKLFEAHGVHRNQIPALIDKGLTIKDVQTEELLFPKLNEELLNYVCELFAVRRAWLDGASDEVYETHDFYKHPELCEAFIERLKSHENAVHHQGVLLVSKASKASKDWHESAVIVLEETVELSKDKFINRYYILNNWSFNYFKQVGYLTACVALLRRNEIYIHGRSVSQESIKKYQDGKSLFEAYSFEEGGSLPLHGSMWHTEDLTLNPEVYIECVAEGVNGKMRALDLWLSLESDGYMDAGYNKTYPNIRENFEQALNDLSNGKPVKSLISICN